jgi:hypothetical protein
MGLRRLLEKAQEASVGGLVELIIAIFVPIIFRSFRDRLDRYPATDLWGGIAVYVIVAGLDVALSRAHRDTGKQRPNAIASHGVYALPVVLFIIATFAQRVPARGSITSVPIYLALALLAMGLIVRMRVAEPQADDAKGPGGTGLATTSVLITALNGSHNFMLILNRNLNNGKGLWVPPGGHFELGVDDPGDRLLQKIRTEVGIEAKIWQPDALPADLVYSFNTAQTKWLAAPVFILDEDLLGLCSHGHARHFDLIYACEAVRYIPHARIKYPIAEQALVPVRDCAASVEAAEVAVHAAIERWQQSTAGTSPGVRDTVSRDVPQRLHLVAVKYTEYLARLGQGQGVITGQS